VTSRPPADRSVTGTEPAGEPAGEPIPHGWWRDIRLWRPWRLALFTLLVGLVACLVSVAGAGLFLAGQYRGTPAPAARSLGRDAVWLGHGWVDGRRGDRDLAGLAARLRSGGFRDVFVHTGPLADDGSLDPALAPRLAWLLRGLHAAVPGLRAQAWLGDLVSAGRLNLADPASRGRIVAATRWVLDVGADGVHYDFEPLPDGDAGFLALLDTTRGLTRARHTVVSVAAEPVEPWPTAQAFSGVLRPVWWTPGYLRAVGDRVDEVATMTYDTAMPTQTLYGGMVTRQARVALDNLPDTVDLLIGLPAYHDRTALHDPAVETVGVAIRAVRLALTDHPGRRHVGVAMYADFTATDQDWATYQRDWRQPTPGRPG
jgi:hypothetical protein